MAFGNWKTAKAEKKVDTTTSHAESMHEIKQLRVSSATSGTETHTPLVLTLAPVACVRTPVTYFCSNISAGSTRSNWTVVPCAGGTKFPQRWLSWPTGM